MYDNVVYVLFVDPSILGWSPNPNSLLSALGLEATLHQPTIDVIYDKLMSTESHNHRKLQRIEKKIKPF